MADSSEYTVHQATFKNGDKLKKNQDSKSIWLNYSDIDPENELLQFTSNLVGFIGVYDGHGNGYGLHISHFTKVFIETYVKSNWESINSNFERAINEMFNLLSINLRIDLKELSEKTYYETRVVGVDAPVGKNYNYIEYKLHKESLWSIMRGGTTVSLQFFLENGESYHVHLGDSECIVFKKKQVDCDYNRDESIVNEVRDKPKYETSYEVPTTNHSPDSLEQYIRVTENYGDNAGRFIYDQHGLVNSNIPVFNNNKLRDPNMLYKLGKNVYHKNVEGEWATLFTDKNNTDCLAFVCSMGDYFLLQAGLSDEPTIVKTDLTAVSSILLASDGLWDNWKKENLKDYYFKLENGKNTDYDIFTKIMDKTNKEAKQNFGSSRDDITAVMVIF